MHKNKNVMDEYRILENGDTCYIVNSKDEYLLYVIDGMDPMGENLLATKYACGKYWNGEESEAYIKMKKIVDDLNRGVSITDILGATFFSANGNPNYEGWRNACEEYRKLYGIRKSIFEE